MSEPVPYIGRFAPSPTGPLHFGSLVAAVASYLQARSNGGQWLLRIENIDPPREQAGSISLILSALEGFGFQWDGEISYQSASHPQHAEALSDLLQRDLAYRCGCSRRDLENVARSSLGAIYPGTCRSGCDAAETAIRIRTNESQLIFDDLVQGEIAHRLEPESGDFVIRRRDGLIAYQLAVVVDDHLQGITEVVRGMDLIDSTPRQIWLQKLLGFRTPNYAHIPVVTHANGDKLSKLTGAPEISVNMCESLLCEALSTLQQNPPAELEGQSLSDIWDWATKNWQIGKIFGQKSIVKTA